MNQPTSKTKITHLKLEIERSRLFADWWMQYANTEANKKRVVHYGGASEEYRGRQLTEAELVNDALGTANSHILRHAELTDSLISELTDKLIEEPNNEQ